MRHTSVISHLLLGVVALSATGCSGEKSATELRAEACTYAEMEITSQLKSPTSAEFPPCVEMDISNKENGGELDFVVSSYVDAENSFGAMLRKYFFCTVSLSQSDYYSVDCYLIE